ncbi:uncharacterized protein N7518_001823 [Penicillium psychrosexuale]|uniref:uncharacterized protein n=1 Tax=Penicillium psychrosexuale TaxID=1002107 RepID=UPI0025453B00|nr:uncharacterized protein N7518_001823 [Penicillium psychrosexuale]KAJ5799755.1 hypothetical protein N7518_001823 [Penicillium psychrosexuale]
MSDQQARESFASILSYYRHNRESLANVPDWVDNPRSGDIVIGFIRNSAPTDEQVERAKEELKSFIAIEGIKETLSEADKALLAAAACSSRAKRLQNKKNKYVNTKRIYLEH